MHVGRIMLAAPPGLSGWAQGLLGTGRSPHLTPVAEYLGSSGLAECHMCG